MMHESINVLPPLSVDVQLGKTERNKMAFIVPSRLAWNTGLSLLAMTTICTSVKAGA